MGWTTIDCLTYLLSNATNREISRSATEELIESAGATYLLGQWVALDSVPGVGFSLTEKQRFNSNMSFFNMIVGDIQHLLETGSCKSLIDSTLKDTEDNMQVKDESLGPITYHKAVMGAPAIAIEAAPGNSIPLEDTEKYFTHVTNAIHAIMSAVKTPPKVTVDTAEDDVKHNRLTLRFGTAASYEIGMLTAEQLERFSGLIQEEITTLFGDLLKEHLNTTQPELSCDLPAEYIPNKFQRIDEQEAEKFVDFPPAMVEPWVVKRDVIEEQDEEGNLRIVHRSTVVPRPHIVEAAVDQMWQEQSHADQGDLIFVLPGSGK